MIFLSMVFLHIIADFNLRGFLANAKQISWWKENYPDKMYEYDWIISMIIHSFMWTFMVLLPLMFIADFKINGEFVIVFISNMILHGMCDHAKANLKKINLTQDQVFHLVQIIITIFILK